MNIDLINSIENFIQNLKHPRKQAIARNLIVDKNYQITQMTVLKETSLYIKDLKTNKIYKFINFINSACNC
jgi:hypothetical protein